ncbi:MAG: patatin family protein [Clostridia bacterium]|nr:patatin family protein [Clostridia bacterium]
MKTGIVLEGGAMRGLFTAGAIDVLMENGIEFHGMAGVSAGACFGCNYKSRQIGRALRYNLKYCRDPRYCSLRSLVTTGDLYGADFCYREIPEVLDPFDIEAYRANPMAFYAVCTDVQTGEAVLHRCDLGNGEDLNWFRASASMPMVSRVVEINGRGYLDGGVADSIPLKRFEEMGYGKNLVVLTQPEGFVKHKSRAFPLMRLMLKKYPAMLRAMEQRPEKYNETLAYIRSREAAGAALVLRPDFPLPVRRTEHDPAKLQACYDHGREVALRRLGEIREFLQ